ncbi:protein tyrosine phosphatase domain-containing protein 1 isoform X1 [Anolis carolinensis]|uniref:Protein tyrosine phosphatase domain-containing protein 1 n=2 Tax=Anolis carolinensis TaxID=28377 RepID=A0A803SSB2_ANOCA|nr:PREDICTED: protein tyrosine phosphatase domain-containing protein 1 isoform X1 [Anolis carolinensis]|eukprot:XP_008113774.1 PREDICTED: protein tyrosine phosphatase domain-containing protein 1 isoform X1 [Anolis carolinensis]
MQGSPRRRLTVNIFSNFFQGRRHSSSDPLLRVLHRRRSSVVEVLSTSTHRVMVAISSVNPDELNAAFYERKRRSRRPTAKYTKVGERLRHVIPGHMQCSMACGGRACKYENPTRWSDQEQAVKGLYSSWVTDNILAMSRPSTELIEKYNIIEQFQRCGIKTVINLQRPGEHASCGNPLEQESGFTYLPEAFMEAGIYFYNFGWKDYGVASLTTILDMVKVMTFALQEGRVAVHCHAGLGRTGVLIACYLVFATRMTADQAILFVRAKRPNSIQTRGQLLCVREFSQFLIPLRNVFASCEPKVHPVTLSQYLIRQRHLLHGYESRHLKHVPKLIHLVCKLLLDLAENRQMIEQELVDLPDLSAEIEETVSQLDSTELEKELTRQDSSASGPFSLSGSNPVNPSDHECDSLWRRRNVDYLQPLGHSKRRMSYSDSDLRRAVFVSEQGETPWSVPVQMPLRNKENQQNSDDNNRTNMADLNKELLIRNTFTFASQGKFNLNSNDRNSQSCRKGSFPKEVQRSKTYSSGLTCHQKEDEEEDDEELKALNYNCSRIANFYGKKMWSSEEDSEHDIHNNRDPSEIPHIIVQSELTLEGRRELAAKALANINEFMEAEEVKQRVEIWQKELNSQNGAWDKICAERDPFILSSLMWSWIEQLKEPLLNKHDVEVLAKDNVDSQEALKLLEKGKYHTILCILNCVVGLQTIPTDVEEMLLDRAVKAFTKMSCDAEDGAYVYNILKNVFKQILEHQRKSSKEGSEKPL